MDNQIRFQYVIEIDLLKEVLLYKGLRASYPQKVWVNHIR